MTKKKQYIIVVFVISAILIATGTFLSFNNNSEKENTPDVADMTGKIDKPDKKLLNVDGVYVLNNISIRLFRIDSKISVHLDDFFIGELVPIEDDTLKLKEKNITIKLQNDEIEVSSDDNTINGIYKKTSDLSLDEYYHQYYTLNDVDGKYNVYYENEYFNLYMYQLDKEKVFVKIIEKGDHDIKSLFENYYNITEDNTLELNNDNFSIKIVIKDDLLTVEGFNSDIEEFINMNGTYNKVKNLTKEEVIINCFI